MQYTTARGKNQPPRGAGTLRRPLEGPRRGRAISGHLKLADMLFSRRLDDYLEGVPTLRPADVTGERTNQEEFNSQEIGSILSGFCQKREEYVQRLEKLSQEDLEKTSLHPRLNKPMRLCDLLYFQAEHDDHHIYRIEELKNQWLSST